MLQVILKSESVTRLRDLLCSRYKKTLRIDWIKSVSTWDIGDRRHRIENATLRIPIQVNQHFFAVAVIEDIEDLSHEDHLLITELVKLILEPEFYNWYLGQLANNTGPRSPANNVVSIFNPHDLREADEFAPAQSSSVIFFQAHDPYLIPRLANEVHEISQRWAFLRFKDIQLQMHSVEDIKSLGTLTLVIDELLELNPQQQTILYQFLIKANPSQDPLLIIGSASEIESLEDQNLVHQGLAHILKIHRLEVDRLPRDSKLLHDALEIMLES